MFKNSIIKLTLNYILIITVLCFFVSSLMYINLVKNTTELFKQEQTRIEKKFGVEDKRYSKKVQFIEDGIKDIQNKAIINLVGLNLIIISIVGFLAYFFAKKTINPIEESVRKQKEFISNVSHELKTPLTALKSSFEIDLKTKGSDLKETLKSGIEEVDKMNLLIDGFLKLSKMDAQKHQLMVENFDLKKCLEDIFRRKDKEFLEKELKVKFYLNNETVITDKFLFSELLSIIIDNAIKFNSNNGGIYINSYSEAEFDFISIRDEGIGIKEENKIKIFERFFKEDASRTRLDGFGVGLALAKEISELLNCEIIVNTRYKKGTEFILKFSALFQK